MHLTKDEIVLLLQVLRMVVWLRVGADPNDSLSIRIKELIGKVRESLP